MVAIPTRSPVKDPGPTETASPSSSFGDQPQSVISRSTTAIMRSECVSAMDCVDSPTR